MYCDFNHKSVFGASEKHYPVVEYVKPRYLKNMRQAKTWVQICGLRSIC